MSLTGSVVAPAYQYDSNGNTVQAMARNLFSLNYDPVSGRTTSIQFGSASGNVLKFSYGLDDCRTLKTYQTAGATPSVRGQVLTLTGLNGQPLAERASAGANVTVRYYIPGISGIVAVMESGEPKFLLSDHLGSQRLLVDGATGNVENTLDYVPFGGLIRANAVPDISRMFAGQELDNETGLYNFPSRLYDPALGRFIATDPATASNSPYVYANNNPISFPGLDPERLAADTVPASDLPSANGNSTPIPFADPSDQEAAAPVEEPEPEFDISVIRAGASSGFGFSPVWKRCSRKLNSEATSPLPSGTAAPFGRGTWRPSPCPNRFHRA